jgi:LuxR family maltose regulon positive regulatory protein
MLNTLLSTKLCIPHPHRELVSRPRLIERLDAGLRGKLMLVSAPAGYGKTTLVSDWIVRSQIPAAWLSLDASDNDVGRFFSYVITALQGRHPDIGTEIQPILESEPDPPIEHLLTTLVNDIAAMGGHLALVLDDYHLIAEWKIHQALDFLLDHLPPRMHMVLISRTNPPMPLGRLRVQNQLTEIREVDLRFTPDEAAAFLNDLMGLELSGSEIESLEARTEGWAAGLQLAALTVQDRADKGERIAALTGSHRHLIEYLVHEVMARQSEEVRTFLLCTSILERFNASLCDAILDHGPMTDDKGLSGPSIVVRPASPSTEILEHLERANLFLVPLDGERQWYRYHHLFADFLQRRLRRTQPEIVPELHVRASQWYESQGMVDEAIEHALTGDDVMRAARVLDEHVEAYVFNAEIIRVLRWADKLPVEARSKFPRLCIYYAWALQFEYQLEAAESALAQAEAHLADPAGLQLAAQSASFPASQITGHASAIRAYIAFRRGEFDRAVELALAALQVLPDEEADRSYLTDGERPADREHPGDEMRVVRGAATLFLGYAYLQLGQTEAAYQALQSALPLNQRAGNRYGALSCLYYMMWIDAECGALGRVITNGEKGLFWIEEWSGSGDRQRPPARLLAHIRRQMGIVLYERDDLDQAARYLRQASEYYELVGSWYRVQGYALLVDLYQALGDVETARGVLRKLVRTNLTPGLSLPDIPLAAIIAERSLLLSRFRPDPDDLFAQAAHWAETSGLEPDDEFRHEQEYDYLTLARVRIAQGKAEEVVPLLDRLIASAESAGRNGQLIAYLALQAVAHQAQGEADTALSCLSRALALGEPEGYVRTFVDLGPPMRDLLQAAARRDSAPHKAYVSRLLAAFPVVEPGVTPSLVATQERRESGDLAEPLNDRERQILRFIAAGLSDHQIAQELYLSINTVKWYNRQIYAKLGVSRRSQAVARARELGVLRDA